MERRQSETLGTSVLSDASFFTLPLSTYEMLIYLVRHGRTDYNREGLIQGQLDIPLNGEGISQARRFASSSRATRFDRIITSQLARARQTAELIAEDQDIDSIQIDPLLTERHWGRLQGQPWQDGFVVPDDGESDQELTDRLRIWLHQLISDHTPRSSPTSSPSKFVPPRDHDQSHRILVVTHQDCLLTLLSILTEPTTHSSPLAQLTIGPEVDVGRQIGNTAVGVVRIWWEEGGDLAGSGMGAGGGLQARGRLDE